MRQHPVIIFFFLALVCSPVDLLVWFKGRASLKPSPLVQAYFVKRMFFGARLGFSAADPICASCTLPIFLSQHMSVNCSGIEEKKTSSHQSDLWKSSPFDVPHSPIPVRQQRHDRTHCTTLWFSVPFKSSATTIFQEVANRGLIVLSVGDLFCICKLAVSGCSTRINGVEYRCKNRTDFVPGSNFQSEVLSFCSVSC